MMKKVAIIALLGFVSLFWSANGFGQTKATIGGQHDATTDLNDAKYAHMGFDDILAKYKGKVIYLDFWASWCGPCKREMPHSLNLQKYFKGQPVAFVFIDLDRKAENWLNAVKNLKITGHHYRVNSKVGSDITQRLQLKYIPRYLIINKKGEIVNDNAPRPSSKESIAAIEKLL